MMFINVDLPDPDCPTMATELAALDGKVDVPQRRHLGEAQVVGLDDVFQLESAPCVLRP